MRDSFIFYRSFYEAIHKVKDKNIKSDIFEAVCELALNKNVKEFGDEVGSIIMELIRPQIEANNTRYDKGQKGGRPQKYDRQKLFDLIKQGLDNNEIANIVGCSPSLVKNLKGSIDGKDKKSKTKRQKVNNDQKPNENVNDNENVNVNDNVNENENQKINKYFEDEELNKLFIEFLQIRKKVKAVNSDRAIKTLINKLSCYNDETKKKMIEQSIVNSWKDVYEVKELRSRQKTSTERMNDVFERFLARGEDDDKKGTD